MPAQRTLPAFHGAQASGDGGRGEHKLLVHVSSGALLPDSSHRLWGDTEQELLRGEHQDVQRILYADVGGLKRVEEEERGCRETVGGKLGVLWGARGRGRRKENG